MKEIRTERLVLRPFKETDLDDLYDILLQLEECVCNAESRTDRETVNKFNGKGSGINDYRFKLQRRFTYCDLLLL